MITEDYVNFETAKLLKEKGFDWDCKQVYDLVRPQSCADGKMYDNFPDENPNAYDELVSAPTLQMAMKWLREVHNIDVVIDAAVGMLGVKVYIPLISTYKPLKDFPSKVCQIKKGIYYKDDKGVIPALQHFDTYEEACEAGIKFCLKNLI